jgi:CHASE2 domain-containing sensor protein
VTERSRRALRRAAAIGIIAAAAAALAVACAVAPVTRDVVQLVDEAFYDAAYRARGVAALSDPEVVILGIDQPALDVVAAETDFTWPWPRGYYGFVTQRLQVMGARAVALDLLMSEKGVYGPDDDQALADAIDGLTIPFVAPPALRFPSPSRSRWATPTSPPSACTDTTTSAPSAATASRSRR